MQEKLRFLSVYGPKVLCAEKFNPDDDTVDPRAPVNNPSELYDSFFGDETRVEIEDTLRDEKITDFDDDVYDYEDRSELGEDIALAQAIDLSRKRPSKQLDIEDYIKNKTKKKPEALDELDDAGDE